MSGGATVESREGAPSSRAGGGCDEGRACGGGNTDGGFEGGREGGFERWRGSSGVGELPCAFASRLQKGHAPDLSWYGRPQRGQLTGGGSASSERGDTSCLQKGQLVMFVAMSRPQCGQGHGFTAFMLADEARFAPSSECLQKGHSLSLGDASRWHPGHLIGSTDSPKPKS
jgi:hypothetical protein